MCQSVFGEVPIKTKYIDLTGYITCMFSSRQQESVFAIKKEVSCIMTSAHLSQVEKRITSHDLKTENVTLPKTNSLPLKDGGWKSTFLLGFGNFSGANC